MISNAITSLLASVASVSNVGLVSIVIALLTWLWWRKPHRNFPPGPRGIPIIGVLPFLGSNPQEVLRKWSLKYGPVMSVRFGDKDIVFLNTYDVINQALVRKGAVFSGRPRIELFTQVLGNFGVIFRQFDDEFRIQKKLGTRILKQFGMGKKEMETIINEESDFFIKHLLDKAGKPIDISLDFINIIGNIISKISLGRRFDYDDPTFRRIFYTIKNQYGNPKQANLIFLFMYLYKYVRHIPPFSGANRMFVQSEIDIADALRPIIEQHKKTFDRNCERDFIDSYLMEQKFGEGRNDPSFTDRQLEVYVRDLFVAGTETTSTTLSWMFLCLLHFPKYYEMIIKEVDTVVDDDSQPSMAHTKDMPITCAFIEEVWRRFTIVPNSLLHEAATDTELNGYFIPKGTQVAPNLYAAHLDPGTWPDPMKFDPHRHIDEDGKFVFTGKIIPFGIGPRFCLGESMARVEANLIFIKMLQHFTFSAGQDKLPDITEGQISVVFSPKEYKMIFKERN